MTDPRQKGSGQDYPGENFAVVRKDEHSGQGVICYKQFKAGDLLLKLQGEIVPGVLQHTLQIAPGKHLLDREFSGYFLHSCAPNISLDMEKLTVTAVQDIAPGDYLFMDYAETEDILFKQFLCRCGSAACRGWITGRKEQPVAGRTADEESPRDEASE